MNRLTGEIKTVKGPAMYLPDPRTEVVVKRKLTPRQCELWFPGNTEAMEYNLSLSEKSVEKSLRFNNLDSITAYCCSFSDEATMANLEAKANISRGTSYTKPRTITLDNKYDGVVSMDIWTGYAVNVISKNGDRKVICGPQTILLDYDQTLEVLQMSTGKPKTTDHLIQTVFLRHENNKVADIISFETAEHVRGSVKVCYSVDFDPESQDKWFNIDNYVKYLCDHTRTLIKRAIKEETIESFYANVYDIVRNAIISPEGDGRLLFAENGMFVHDCEILDVAVEDSVARLLNTHKYDMVQKSLELRDAERRVALATQLAEAEKAESELKSQQLLDTMALQRTEALKKQEIQAEINRIKEAEDRAATEAKRDLQVVLNAVADAENARKKEAHRVSMECEATELANQEAHTEKMAAIEKAKNDSYAATVVAIMGAVQPELVAALESQANAEVTKALGAAINPYIMAGEGESVADVVQKLTHGTTVEDFLKKFQQ